MSKQWMVDLLDEYPAKKRTDSQVERLGRVYGHESEPVMLAAVGAYMRDGNVFFPKVADLARYVGAARTAGGEGREPAYVVDPLAARRERLMELFVEGIFDPAEWQKLIGLFELAGRHSAAAATENRLRRAMAGEEECSRANIVADEVKQKAAAQAAA